MYWTIGTLLIKHIFSKKTELLFLQSKDSPIHDISINIGTSVVSLTQTSRNLGVTLADQLSFTFNIAATTHFCRYTLCNIRNSSRNQQPDWSSTSISFPTMHRSSAPFSDCPNPLQDTGLSCCRWIWSFLHPGYG